MLRDERAAALDAAAVACRETADHLEEAVGMVEAAAMAEQLRELAARHRAMAAELAAHVRRLGELPSEPDPEREAAHGLVTRLKAALSGDRSETAIARCVEAEHRLTVQLDAALAADPPAEARALLQRCQASAAEAGRTLAAISG